MAFEDFCRYFSKATMCHLMNTSILSLSKRWHLFKHTNEWKLGFSAGGCVTNQETFFRNPQVMEITYSKIYPPFSRSLSPFLIPICSHQCPYSFLLLAFKKKNFLFVVLENLCNYSLREVVADTLPTSLPTNITKPLFSCRLTWSSCNTYPSYSSAFLLK